MRFLPLLLLAWPFAEIATFIWIGGRIGVLGTLALIILAGVVGVAVARLQGLALLREIQREMNAGRAPAAQVLRGAMTAFAGLLFLLPGFLSDIVAILLLLPPVQAAVARWAAANVTVVAASGAGRRPPRPQDGVVDLDPADYERRDAGSPWSEPEPPSDGAEPPRITRS